jgi:hypothetical protein
MALTKRVMILFDAERYRKLEEEARQRHCSVGALIRETLENEVLRKAKASRSAKLQAAKRLTSMEEDVPDWDRTERLIARGHLHD